MCDCKSEPHVSKPYQHSLQIRLDLLLEVRSRQRLDRILFRQQLLIPKRHKGIGPLELGLSQRIQIIRLVNMSVFAFPCMRLLFWVEATQRGDVDV